MARIVRTGKLTLAALEATLPLFLDEEQAIQEVPTLRMLARSVREISEQAEWIAGALSEQQVTADISVTKGYSQMGSGSLPTQNLPTRLVVVVPRNILPRELGLRLRLSTPAIFTRLKRERILIDPRTLLAGEQTTLVDTLAQVLGTEGS